jgi:PAS domain S-box-containing protein
MLQESEDPYRTIVEEQTEFISRFLPDGTHVFANEAYCNCFGKPRDEITGHIFVPDIPAEDKRLVQQHFQSLTPKNPVATVTHRIIAPDGSVHWHRWSDRAIFDEIGSIVEYQSVGRDITDQKQNEEALLESQAKYRLLADHVHDVIWTADRDLHLTFISPSITALRGVTPGEALEESLADSMTPESYGKIMEMRRRGMEALMLGKPMPHSMAMDLEFYCKDGPTVWTETVITLTFGPSMIPVGVVGITRDISSRRQAEKALRESEEKFRSFVENANDIVFSTTPDGVFIYVSPKWTELLGHETSELIGKKVTGFVHPDDIPGVLEILDNAMKTGKKITRMECRIQHKNGSWQWHTQGGSLIRDAGGNVVSFVGISHDISERRRAEDSIRLANRQLSLLNSITRHDILNKITIILGYLDLAESTSPDPDLAGYLENMESATRAIQSQIEFTRVYQDLGTHEAQWIDLDTIVTHLQVPAAITLESGVQGVFVFADPILEKVFFNLLDNSIRHGQRVTKIRVCTHRAGKDLVVVWEDNGAGIAADEKERIFERGFGKNTGLGMFLVREILSITGITILETGEPGKGVRFEMAIPRGMFRYPAPR